MGASRKSAMQKLFVGAVLFHAVLLLISVPIWTVITAPRTYDKTRTECLDMRNTQRRSPLLCMFTTFKPTTAKIPVRMDRNVHRYANRMHANR